MVNIVTNSTFCYLVLCILPLSGELNRTLIMLMGVVDYLRREVFTEGLDGWGEARGEGVYSTQTGVGLQLMLSTSSRFGPYGI